MAIHTIEPALLHAFKNHLSIIYSFSDFILAKLPEGELREDVFEIRKASIAALEILPKLETHERD